MAPLVHCVRHAQGLHNISVANLGIPDPRLTPLGERQCALLASNFPSTDRISLVVASPLTRTIQTAHLSFGGQLGRGRCASSILALPEAQETSELVSDTGSDPDVLRHLCRQNGWPVNLDLVQEGWNVKTSEEWLPTYNSISKRAKAARIFIWNKTQELQQEGHESPEIVLVTDGGFLHYFTEDWEGSGVDHAHKEGRASDIRWDIPGTAWQNTEFRSYEMSMPDAGMDADPLLTETQESRERRSTMSSSVDQRLAQELWQAAVQCSQSSLIGTTGVERVQETKVRAC